MEDAARTVCSSCAAGQVLVHGTTARSAERTYRHEAHGARCAAWGIWKMLRPEVPEVCPDDGAPCGFVRVGREGWDRGPVPEVRGIWRTLGARWESFRVAGDEPAFVARSAHGAALNPELGHGPSWSLAGPVRVLFFVRLEVHPSGGGEPREFPFTFGHRDDLDDEAMLGWQRECLRRLLEHELDEAVPG